MQERDNYNFNSLFIDQETNQLRLNCTFEQLNFFSANNFQRGFTTKNEYYETFLLDFIRNKRKEFVLDTEKVYNQLITYAQFMARHGPENFGMVLRKSEKVVPILRAFCENLRINFIYSSPGLLTNRGVSLPRFLIFYDQCSLFNEVQNYTQHVLTLFYTPDRPPSGADYFLIKGNYSVETVRVYFDLLAWLVRYFQNTSQ